MTLFKSETPVLDHREAWAWYWMARLLERLPEGAFRCLHVSPMGGFYDGLGLFEFFEDGRFQQRVFINLRGSCQAGADQRLRRYEHWSLGGFASAEAYLEALIAAVGFSGQPARSSAQSVTAQLFSRLAHRYGVMARGTFHEDHLVEGFERSAF